MLKHQCIKCHQSYEDNDPDDYYCSTCNEDRKRIAKEIDAKIGSMPHKRVAPSFQEMVDSLPKIPGTNIPFIS